MAEHVYEAMFILDTNRYQRDPAGTAGQIPELVARFEGTVLASRLWEDRRLAYPIKGQRRGAYWLTYFRMDSSHLVAINRELQINDNVLRHLILKIDPRIVDALVSHVKDVPVAKKPEPVAVAVGAAVGADLEVPEDLNEI